MIEPLEIRRLLAAQAYDWNSVAIKGNGFIDGIVYAQNAGASGLAYIHTDMGGAYRLDSASNRWTPLTDWIQIGDAIQNNGAVTMAVDPTDPNKVYLVAGTYRSTGAFLRSTDQGRTWQRTDVSGILVDGNGWGRDLGERLIVDPNLPATLYYGANYFDGSHRGLWKSTDSGATWSQVGNFTSYGDVWTGSYSGSSGVGLPFVLVDKTSGTSGSASQRIYVANATSASSNNKLLRTTDGGTTWQAIPNQPTTTNFPLRAALSADGSVMYVTYGSQAGPLSSGDTGVVYKVSNPGSPSPTWTTITPSGASGLWMAIAIDPTNNNTVYTATENGYPCNIYRSTNGGSSWSAVTSWNYNNYATNRDDSSAPFAATQRVHWLGDLQIDPFNRNVAMFTTGYGIYRTTNLTAAAPTWTFYNDGFEQTAAAELVSPSSGSVHLLSALGDRGGFRHVDFAVSQPPFGITNGLNVGTDSDIDVSWNDPNYVVRATYTSPYVQYSLNNGQTWSSFSNTNDDLGAGGSIAISADGLYTVYEPTGTHGSNVANQVIYSIRSGTTWGSWTDPTTNRPADGAKIIADLAEPHTFYAYAATTVSMSTDGGATWAVQTTSAPSGAPWIRAVGGNAGHLLMADDWGGLYRSTNHGATWTQVSGGVTVAHQVGVGMAKPGNSYPAVFVGGTVGGINGFFRCDDITAPTPVWTLISDLAHNYGYVTVIQGDPQVYGRLYVGANGRGVLYADIHTTPASLPGGWTGADIGTTGGAAGESSGTFDLTGGGSGITASSDQFRFAYQQLTGDGAITAKVTDFSNGAPNSYTAEAGVMIRDTLAATSANAFVALTPGSVGGVAFTTRASAGSSTSSIASATTGVWPPYWVRLVRVGNNFSAYRSPDGVNWTQLGATQTIAMNSTVYFGLANTSASSTQVNLSHFTNVSIQPITAPAATIGAVSPNPHSGGIASFSITFDQAVSGFDLGDLTLSRDGGGVSLAGATLSSGDGGVTWTLAGTTGMTDDVGSYMLTVIAAGSGITNTYGSAIAANESEGWVMNVLGGGASDDAIRLVRNGVGTEYRLGGVLQYSFNAALLPTLVVNTNAGDDVVTLDYSTGDPTPTGATIDAGGDSDTLAIVGTSGVDTAVFNSATVTIGGAVNHSNVENFTFDGNGGSDNLSIAAIKVASLATTQLLDSLAITAGGTLDLLNHAVRVNSGDIGSWDGSAYTGLTGLIAAGRNGGNWSGPGITSSTAAADVGLTAVAIVPVTADSSILIRYTYSGDAALDGKINIDDYTRIDTGIAAQMKGWINGDFNYDGKINIDDYVIIDGTIASQGDPL
jgi:photosystem II stability/assembly factor-like uncharacterized protein